MVDDQKENEQTGTQPSVGLWDVQQVAKWLGVSAAWVRDHATRKAPRLPCIKLGKLLKFRPEAVEQFIAALSIGGDATA